MAGGVGGVVIKSHAIAQRHRPRIQAPHDCRRADRRLSGRAGEVRAAQPLPAQGRTRLVRRPGGGLSPAGRRTDPPRLAHPLPGQPGPARPRPGSGAGLLPAGGAARAGRHGPGLQGPAHPHGPPRRPQGHPRRPPQPAGTAGPLPPRDAGGRQAGAPQRRARPRRRPGRRQLLSGYGVHPGRRPGPVARRARPAPRRGGLRLRPAGGAGVAARPRARPGPPRRQAVQPDSGGRGERGQGPGPGPGAACVSTWTGARRPPA